MHSNGQPADPIHYWRPEWDATKCGLRWDAGEVMVTHRESATCRACLAR
jgi:hypothetical protein